MKGPRELELEFDRRFARAVARHAGQEMLASRGQYLVARLRQEVEAKWPTPSIMDAWAYLVTEVGEVGDALLRAGFGHRKDYVRNHPREFNLEAELGDVHLMLCTLASLLGVDLDDALQGRIDHLLKKHKEESR